MPSLIKTNNLSPGEKAAAVFVGVMVAVMLILGVFGNNGLITYLQLKEKHQEMQAGVEKLEEENKNLTEEIGRLRNDPATIEHIARDELGLVKPGEILYRVKKAREGGPK